MPKFGTLNVNGLKKIQHNDHSRSLELTSLMEDIKTHGIDVLAVQESHLGEDEYLQNEPGYKAFFVNDAGNRHHGAGIVIRDIFKPIFKRISARVCTASFKVANDKHFIFISGYAPHESLSQ